MKRPSIKIGALKIISYRQTFRTLLTLISQKVNCPINKVNKILKVLLNLTANKDLPFFILSIILECSGSVRWSWRSPAMSNSLWQTLQKNWGRRLSSSDRRSDFVLSRSDFVMSRSDFVLWRSDFVLSRSEAVLSRSEFDLFRSDFQILDRRQRYRDDSKWSLQSRLEKRDFHFKD